MILYVRKNEETSYLKIIHFYEEEKGIPSELEANAKSECSRFPSGGQRLMTTSVFSP